MGKKGGSRHLKREKAPRFWPIHRKEFHWAVKPKPGPHPINQCIPLVIVVRETLGYAKTRKEAKHVISQGKIKVDGKVRRDGLFPAGLTDVISIPEIGKNFRVLPSEKGLTLHLIEESEAGFKLCRIEGKTTMKDGHVQLNLHDGRNLMIPVEDPQNPESDTRRTLDSLRIELKDQSVIEHLMLAEGAFAMIIGGKNIGKFGRIVSIDESGQERRRTLATIEDERGERYQTILDYVFVIGDERPGISLPKLGGG